jgi:murein DD-endopeptidase MepM/ murein hydrolase activator NlpD
VPAPPSVALSIFHAATAHSFADTEAAVGRLRLRVAGHSYRQRTRMSLPVAGEWIVCNGGRDPAHNVHPYAYDFVRPHRGTGEALADYEAYGAAVLAPAAGVVCRVVSDQPDTPPGREDASGMPNLIVIDHGAGEWSFLAHFRPNSIRVSPGQRVARAQLIGECGNSGDSSEPHVHLHLQSSSDLDRLDQDMLPLALSDLLVDGRLIRHAEPNRGQRVEMARLKSP